MTSIGRYALVVLLCLQVAACAGYAGPVNNRADRIPSDGPPLLSGYYAP